MKFRVKDLYICNMDRIVKIDYFDISGKPVSEVEYPVPYTHKPVWEHKPFRAICYKDKYGKFQHVLTKQHVNDLSEGIWGYERNQYFGKDMTSLTVFNLKLGRNLSYKQIADLEKSLNRDNENYLKVPGISYLYQMNRVLGSDTDEIEKE